MQQWVLNLTRWSTKVKCIQKKGGKKNKATCLTKPEFIFDLSVFTGWIPPHSPTLKSLFFTSLGLSDVLGPLYNEVHSNKHAAPGSSSRITKMRFLEKHSSFLFIVLHNSDELLDVIVYSSITFGMNCFFFTSRTYRWIICWKKFKHINYSTYAITGVYSICT